MCLDSDSENEISQMCDIHIGVPQGSVLGPILFLLYVNDINQHIHIGAACNLYADDTLAIALPIMLILYMNVPIIL